MLLALFIYYRSYVSHLFMGMLFDVTDSTICRTYQKLEPILAKKIHIKKDKNLTPDKLVEILADVTEISIQRPKKKQKETYSGKKKKNSNKFEIIIDSKSKKITNISKIFSGKTHDFRIRKESDFLPNSSSLRALVDSGYQGLQKMLPKSKVKLPFKRRKNQPLTKRQRQYNKLLSSRRIAVDHTISQMKRFQILSQKYRNFQKKLNLRVNIIAGIVNLKNGFLPV